MPIRLKTSMIVFFLMIRRPPRSTLDRSSAASDVYKRQSLSCAKVKGKKFSDVLLKLDREARWFVNTHKAPAKELTSYQRLVEIVRGFGRPVKRSEIVKALK